MTRKEKIASERRRQKELERVEAYNQNRLKDGESTVKTQEPKNLAKKEA